MNLTIPTFVAPPPPRLYYCQLQDWLQLSMIQLSVVVRLLGCNKESLYHYICLIKAIHFVKIDLPPLLMTTRWSKIIARFYQILYLAIYPALLL